MNLSEQKMFDVSDLGHLASPRTWRRLIQRGEIGVLRIGGGVKVPEAELERFLSERFVAPRKQREDRPQTVSEAIDRVLPRLRVAR